MNKILGQIGGRKFIIALFSLVGVVVLAKWNVDISKYQDAFVGITGAYLIGQGVADGLSGGATSTVAALAPKDVG